MFVLVSYSTVSNFSIPKVSTSADRHKLKSNGIVTSSGPLRTAPSMESSPIKTVSTKSEITVQKWRKHLFLFALLTRLGRRWSVLRREPQQHNLPSIFFINMKMVIFVFVVVVAACACFVVVRDGVSPSCASLVQRVSRAWRVAQVSRGCFFIVVHEFFISCFIVVLDVLVAGDLRHEYAQSSWGFLFRGPPDCCLRSSRFRRGDWRSFDEDCRRGMSIVVILTTSSRLLCRVRRRGRRVAPRLIPTALLVALAGRSSRERFGASQWWRRSRPSRSLMALIGPIAIGDGVVACCRLSRLCIVPTLAWC